jgi:hypothetical protein
MVVRAADMRGHRLNLPHGELLRSPWMQRSLHPKGGTRWSGLFPRQG